MRIRTKLFVLLIVIAVLPLVALSWRTLISTERLGMDVADRGRAAVSQTLRNQLQQAVTFSSTIMQLGQYRVEQALRIQALEVEDRLAGIDVGEAPVYFSADFDKVETWPPGTASSAKHERRLSADRVEAVPINLDHQVFVLPPTVDREDVRGDLFTMQSMRDAYRAIYQANQDLIYWQYTSFPSGLHSAYPGHGGYPEAYDPRTRVWYATARAHGDLVWNPPLVDASTRQVILTASMPVRFFDGSFAGVTAIDVDIIAVLQSVTEGLQVAEGAQSLLVTLPDGNDLPPIAPEMTNGEQLIVLASAAYEQTALDWEGAVQNYVVSSPDQDRFAMMLDDLRAGRPGVQEMPYNGEASLWVYGQLERLSAAILYIVPVSQIDAVAAEAQAFVGEAVTQQLQLAAVASLALIVLVAALAMLSARTITQPLMELAGTMRQIATGNLDARAQVRTADEIGEVAQAVNTMVPKLQENIAVRQSLALAQEVQQNLLPSAAPEVPGIDVSGVILYSDQTGGDYYDFIECPDGDKKELGVAVADVTGHGIAAALIMAELRTLLRSHVFEEKTIAGVMTQINAHMAADSVRGRFASMLYMTLDPESRSVRWVDAGHGAAMKWCPDMEDFVDLGGDDIPVGIEADWTYTERGQGDLPEGTVFILMTDGLWEQRNPEGEMFGLERVKSIVSSHAEGRAHHISRAVLGALADFRRDAAQADDVTLVIAKFV